MYIFISHSSNEANTAKELCNLIESKGHKCFIAPRDIRFGHEYAEDIANGIDGADAVLLILSKAANASPHVLREVERAVTKSIPILVYKVEDVELTKSMEYFLMTHQWMEAKKSSYEDVLSCIDNMGNTEPESVVEVGTGKKKDKHNKKLKTMLLIAVTAVVILTAALAVVLNWNSNKAGREVIDINLGDTVVMGTYNGEDIYWRVLKISDDGEEAVLVARDVLTVKAFDAAESGRYNHDGTTNYYFDSDMPEGDMELQAYIKGSSSWENSNIRTWLNSTSENVKYEGQAPVSAAMADGTNGYNNEKGFLCDFTEKELAAIKETAVETKGNILSEAETIITQDKVFLLSMDELKWFEEADVSLLAVPTEKAIKNNQTYWYKDYCLGYGVETMMWWLREPVAESSCKCYLVGNGYYEENIYTWEVGVESFGIRPAITVDLTSESIIVQ